MSVSLEEILSSSGYKVSDNIRDAQWLLSKVPEFEQLIVEAEDLIEASEEE